MFAQHFADMWWAYTVIFVMICLSAYFSASEIAFNASNKMRLRRAAEECEKAGVNYRVGNILSSDMFYNDAGTDMDWAKMGVLGVEMESAALYCNAARAGKKALCICTVSDSFVYPEEITTPEERQTSFTKMMEIALALA